MNFIHLQGHLGENGKIYDTSVLHLMQVFPFKWIYVKTIDVNSHLLLLARLERDHNIPHTLSSLSWLRAYLPYNIYLQFTLIIFIFSKLKGEEREKIIYYSLN